MADKPGTAASPDIGPDIGLLGLARGFLALAFLMLNTVVWFVPICLLGAIRRVSPEPLRSACGTGLDASLRGWVACAAAMAATLKVTRLRVDSAADSPPLRRDAWYLLIANHQSWADILVLAFAFRRRMPPPKFFTKRELIWLPLVGLALWMLEYPFVRRHGRERLRTAPALAEQDRNAILRSCRAMMERPTSVLSFLEGTRFTVAKRKAQGSPHTALLRPKVGGLQLIVDALEERIAAVVDATILYPRGAPGFWRYLCGGCPVVHVHVRQLPLPRGDRDQLRQWVDRVWSEKDARLLAAGCNPLEADRCEERRASGSELSS